MIKILSILADFLAKKTIDAEIDKKKFIKIEKEAVGKIYAVDGGNATIYDGGTWILQKIRVSIVGYNLKKIFEQKKAVETHLIYGWSENKIEKKFDNFDAEMPGLSFDGLKFEDIGDHIRKIIETMTAMKFLEKMDNNDILLIDGIFSSESKDEKWAVDKLVDEAKRRSIILVGIAKTSRLRTKSGGNMLGLIAKNSPAGKWHYKLEDNDFAVKLHNQSENVFRINVSSDIEKCLPILAFYSKDPLIAGYPYPLIKADKISRISENESMLERNLIRLGAKKEGFYEDIKTQLFHSKLDKRNFR